MPDGVGKLGTTGVREHVESGGTHSAAAATREIGITN
jgi:hypothetical protein